MAFSKARHNVEKPTPRLVMTRDMTKSQGTGAKAVSSEPPMTNSTEMRLKSKSRLKGSYSHLFTSIQDPAGSITKSATSAVILPIVCTYVA